MTDRPKIHIVAGNRHEFEEYLQGKQYTSDYVYVENIRNLKGLQYVKGFFIGTYEDRPDIELLKSEIEVIKLKMELRKALNKPV